VIRLIEQVKADLAEVPQGLDNIKQFINDFEECSNNVRTKTVKAYRYDHSPKASSARGKWTGDRGPLSRMAWSRSSSREPGRGSGRARGLEVAPPGRSQGFMFRIKSLRWSVTQASMIIDFSQVS